MSNSNPNSSEPSPQPKSFAIKARDSLGSMAMIFSLVFIFRGFVAEAFVIPTGSMAPTLYGQQLTHTCSTCGFEYARGVDDQLAAKFPTYEWTLKCPNCGSTMDKIPSAQLARPSGGDRIMVHKWPFSIGGSLGPQRWDVTVFKDPSNGTVNYIKRMVGQPGDILEIIQGDVYAAAIDEVRGKDPGIITDMDQLREDLYKYAHGELRLEGEQVADRYRSINQRLIPFLRIQRKAIDAPDAQESLWLNVYNRDFRPNRERTGGEPRSLAGWFPVPEHQEPGPDTGGQAGSGTKPETAWNTSGAQISLESDSGRLSSIEFAGKPIDDFYGYDYNPVLKMLPNVPVGDLRLKFTWFPEAGDGSLGLEMNRHKDNFVASIQADGTVEINRSAPGAAKPNLIGRVKLDPFRFGKAVRVEFTNVDFRVSLVIDGREVLASSDQQYAPDIPELLSRNGEDPAQTVPSQVRISGRKMRFRIAHLELDRDVYYRSVPMLEARTPPPQPGQSTGSYKIADNPFVNWPGWGTQGWPIMLRHGDVNEYFMLGDNSPLSKDSRLWWEVGPHLQHLGSQYQPGTVPEDQLMGQAFFVYWSGGYRRSWTGDLGIIPNFGGMRWIR